MNKLITTKKLTLLDSISLIVTLIIGAGIYETSPTIARGLPSIGGVIILWILGGIISLAGALVYAELATSYPEDGGDYGYLKRSYGETIAYLFAWGRFIIVQPGSIASMAFLFSKYFYEFLSSISIHSPLSQEMLAITCVLSLTLVNCLKETNGKLLQNFLTCLKVTCLLFIISLALLAGDLQDTPTTATQFDLSNFNLAIILILFTYGGWNEIVYVASEVDCPEQNFLKSLVYGVCIVCILYIMVNLSFFYILGHEGVISSQNITLDTISSIIPNKAITVTNLIIAVSCFGATHGHIYTGSRINYILGVNYKFFSKLAMKSNLESTPVNAYLIQATISSLIIFFTHNFAQSVVYTTTVVWFFFLLTGIALFKLRHLDKSTHRPYQVTFYPVTPIIFCLASLYLTVSAFIYSPLGSLASLTILLLGLILIKQR